MEEVILEIRAAEGGEDAKLLVEDYIGIYTKYAARGGL
jgi:protein subunit release factor A